MFILYIKLIRISKQFVAIATVLLSGSMFCMFGLNRSSNCSTENVYNELFVCTEHKKNAHC